VMAIGVAKSFGTAMADDLRFVATDVTSVVIANPGHWLGPGAVAAPHPPRGAVDDHLLLSRLDGLAVCDLDAVHVTEKLRPRSQEVVVLLRGDAVQRDDRRVARRRRHRLSAASYPEPADRAFAVDCRQLGALSWPGWCRQSLSTIW
jgi:hypothetical protein